MINGETVLAVIPARGGSKRTPRKNIKLFMGKPLIYWSIQAARACKLVDRVILSTEDQEIRDVGNLLGVEVLSRPMELATDQARSEDALRHALAHAPSEWLVLLQPTSPLRLAQDIERALLIASMGGRPCIAYNVETAAKNGAAYACRSAFLLNGGDFGMPHNQYLMPASRSLDIDFPEQFQ